MKVAFSHFQLVDESDEEAHESDEEALKQIK